MDPDSNPIPTAVKELLAMFDGPLADVHFPDVDGASLHEQATSVDEAVRSVEAAAAAWAEAKREVDARLEVLLQRAQRALAYAKVYAEDKPELDAQLAGIIIPKWGDPRGTKSESVAARKRGRAKKTTPAAEAPAAEAPVTMLPAKADEPEDVLSEGPSSTDIATAAE